MSNAGKLSSADRAAFLKTSRKLGLNPYEFGGLIQLESGFRPNVWGGEGNNFRGLIQFGPGARNEVNLPNRDMTIAEQLPYVEKYFSQRGFKPGMGIEKAYATVLVGNPGGSLTAKDSNNTSVGSAAPRMKAGGDLYKAAQSMIGDVDMNSQSSADQQAQAMSAVSQAPPNPPEKPANTSGGNNVLNVYFGQGSQHSDKKDKAKSLLEQAKETMMMGMLQQVMDPMGMMGGMMTPGMPSGAFNPFSFLQDN